MKKIISVFVLICWLAMPGISQVRDQQRPMAGMLETMKIGFITKRLNLTPDEAQRFWPIYNQYEAEVRQAYLSYREQKNELELDEALLTIKKKYSIDFTRALSPGKVNDFFRAEKDFGAIVQKEMQRRQMRGQQRRPFNGER